jgi:hypothetical protein
MIDGVLFLDSDTGGRAMASFLDGLAPSLATGFTFSFRLDRAHVVAYIWDAVSAEPAEIRTLPPGAD